MPRRAWLSPRAALARHPRVADTLVATPVVLAGWLSVLGVGFSVFHWLWFAAVHVPLVWRRRAPVLVFWAVVGLMLGSGVAGADGDYQSFAPLFALYAVARYRRWRHLLPIGTVVTLALSYSLLASGDLSAGDAAFVVIVTALIIVLGVAIQARRSFQAERAERIEREREQRAELAVVAERARIAREMHDIVAHNLAVMIALADGATAATTSAPDTAADAMRLVARTGRQAMTEMRHLLGILRDGGPAADPRTPQPGIADIDDLVEQVRSAGLLVTLTSEGSPDACGQGAGLAVYRIVQEALTNTLKHAGPLASAHVRLWFTDTGVDLEVTDDGAGRPATAVVGQPDTGHGLAGMLERVAPYGGLVDARPQQGAGWLVRASLRFDETTWEASGDDPAAAR